jgi:hypothetical protein
MYKKQPISKIVKTHIEFYIAKTQLTEAHDYVDWVPPERLHTIDILFFLLYN